MAASLNDAMRYGNTVLPVCHIRKPSMLDMQGPAFLVKSGNRLFPITSRQRLFSASESKGNANKAFSQCAFYKSIWFRFRLLCPLRPVRPAKKYDKTGKNSKYQQKKRWTAG